MVSAYKLIALPVSFGVRCATDELTPGAHLFSDTRPRREPGTARRRRIESGSSCPLDCLALWQRVPVPFLAGHHRASAVRDPRLAGRGYAHCPPALLCLMPLTPRETHDGPAFGPSSGCPSGTVSVSHRQPRRQRRT